MATQLPCKTSCSDQGNYLPKPEPFYYSTFQTKSLYLYAHLLETLVESTHKQVAHVNASHQKFPLLLSYDPQTQGQICKERIRDVLVAKLNLFQLHMPSEVFTMASHLTLRALSTSRSFKLTKFNVLKTAVILILLSYKQLAENLESYCNLEHQDAISLFNSQEGAYTPKQQKLTKTQIKQIKRQFLQKRMSLPLTELLESHLTNVSLEELEFMIGSQLLDWNLYVSQQEFREHSEFLSKEYSKQKVQQTIANTIKKECQKYLFSQKHRRSSHESLHSSTDCSDDQSLSQKRTLPKAAVNQASLKCLAYSPSRLLEEEDLSHDMQLLFDLDENHDVITNSL